MPWKNMSFEGVRLPIVLYFVGGKVALGTRAVQVLSVFSNIGLGNVCACIVFQILLRAFNSAIASDLSRLEWVWRLLLGIGIVLAALTLYAGLTIGETAQYKQSQSLRVESHSPSDIAYYGINLNQSIILSRIRYSTSATPSEKLWKLAIGNLIVQSAKTPDEDRTISPVSTLESSSLTASAASDNNAGVVSLTVFSTPPGPESVPPAHTPPPPG
ncbi:putative inorganic phosphate transporter C23D3.12 [Aspergillus udagawae]|uniref:Putative inorganic phosphate transporter C23D3.12 n=1 Tax=Aspergillus udagawae TaxID=91492 RepID=A0A8H3SC27_9EURO|nr:putative inorganic phosphate transporter C23D3.12 [Aspergillus udagawae]